MPLQTRQSLIPPGYVSALKTRTATLHGNNSETGFGVVLRRDGVSLPTQDVRIAYQGKGGTQLSADSEGKSFTATLLGPPSFDVREHDEFNDPYGELWEVVTVQAQRGMRTRATAQAKQ